MNRRLLLLALFAIGAGYLLLSTQIVLDPWSAADTVHSRTLPQLYGILLCLAVLVCALRQPKTGSDNDQANDEASGQPALRLRPLLAFTALISVFIVSLHWLNLWLAVAGLLFCSLFICGERRWRALSTISITTSLLGYLAIEQLLQMSIPIS